MEFEEIVFLGAQQDGVLWNAAFSAFCQPESCPREQVLSRQHEQGFELENDKKSWFLSSEIVQCYTRR